MIPGARPAHNSLMGLTTCEHCLQVNVSFASASNHIGPLKINIKRVHVSSVVPDYGTIYERNLHKILNDTPLID